MLYEYKNDAMTMKEINEVLNSYRAHLSFGHSDHLQYNVLQHFVLTKGEK